MHRAKRKPVRPILYAIHFLVDLFARQFEIKWNGGPRLSNNHRMIILPPKKSSSRVGLKVAYIEQPVKAPGDFSSNDAFTGPG